MHIKHGTLTTRDGRTVGFADYGKPGQTPLVWCHGGPGSRLEPSWVAEEASRAGLRLIGIDRPGYGQSTPQPGRTIGGWVSDGMAVVDRLGIDRFLTLGASTGGAYALALAAHAPRVIGTVACCAVSDMRWAEGKAMNVACHPIWNARDRNEAIDIGIVEFGPHGEKIVDPLAPIGTDASDVALHGTPAFHSWWTSVVPEMFRQGVVGFVDDRLADAHGWGTFDVGTITCPVTVLHGSTDGLMNVANVYHTASIVPGATLRIVDGLGHLSILTKAIDTATDLLARTAATR